MKIGTHFYQIIWRTTQIIEIFFCLSKQLLKRLFSKSASRKLSELTFTFREIFLIGVLKCLYKCLFERYIWEIFLTERSFWEVFDKFYSWFCDFWMSFFDRVHCALLNFEKKRLIEGKSDKISLLCVIDERRSVGLIDYLLTNAAPSAAAML